MADRIYVQVPAYRDAELLPTLRDLLATAEHPDRLVVAVAWQYGADEAHLAPELAALPQVRLIPIPARESRGCNWARNLLQREWSGEEYTLLLDSHHRFVPGWDTTLVTLLEQQRRAGSPDPVLTGYLPPYDPARDPAGRVHAVYDLVLAERHEGLAFRLTGDAVPDRARLAAPAPAPFVSLHFLFADGSLNERVPADPDVYFFADEVAVALRAFSHGYDLFRPHVVLGWHLYDRSTRRTHWVDHPDWPAQHERSTARLRSLYRGELTGRYGLGRHRTVADYESYAGVRLVEPPRLEGKVHTWSSHLARAIGSRASTATSPRRSSSG